MSAETIKDFLVSLGFKTDQGGFRNFTAKIGEATLTVAALGFAAKEVGEKLTEFFAGTAEQLAQVGELAERVNTTATELGRLGYEAVMTGSSVEAADSSIQNFNRTIGEAAIGVGRGRIIFEKLGISVRDSNGHIKDTGALLDEVKKKVNSFGSVSEQQAAFEKLGFDPTLIKMLTTDMSGLAAEYDKLLKSSGIDMNSAVETSTEFRDSLNKLKSTFGFLQEALAVKFMPKLTEGMMRLQQFLENNMPQVINAISPIIDIALRISSAFLILLGRAAELATKLISWFSQLGKATHGWSTDIIGLVVAWRYLNVAFLASPIGIILSLGTAIALLYDDFKVWQEGGKSLINWGRWKTEIDFAVKAFNFLKNTLIFDEQALVKSIQNIINIVMDLVNAFYKAKNVVGNFIKSGKSTYGNMQPSLMPKTNGLVGGLLGQALASHNQNLNQTTNITVNGSTNPATTAQSVASQQNKVNANMARNFRPVAR